MLCSLFTTMVVTTSIPVLQASSSQALRVVSPSEGMGVIADKPFEVEWTGDDEEDRFDIDLYYCGSYSYCFDDDCETYLASLCPEGDAGCAAQDGGYEVVLPEPIESGDGYRIRISEVGGDEVRCSDSFYLMGSEERMSGTGASIRAVFPTSESVALAGEEYTVEFEYDNGFGSSVGRFKIDQYDEKESPGDCGTWKTSICDKPDSGCKDTQGDYDVVIPASTTSGMYMIRVGLWGDDAVYAYSDAFEVMSLGSPSV